MEMVSGGATPSALSTSIPATISLSASRCDGAIECRWAHGVHTSKAIQSKLIDLVQSRGVLEIILNNVDVVGRSQQTCERRAFGIP